MELARERSKLETPPHADDHLIHDELLERPFQIVLEYGPKLFESVAALVGEGFA